MRVKAWLKYFMIMSAILLTEFLPKIINQDEAWKTNPFTRYTVMTSIIYVVLGLLLGLDYFISLFKINGKWRINLPKVIFIVIPTFFLSACCYLVSVNYESDKYSFLQPVFNFLALNQIFISVLQLILGYSIITSVCRYEEESVGIKAKSWLKYPAYLFIIVMIQLCGGKVYKYTSLRAYLLNIEMLALYAGLGLLLGTEYLTAEANKKGTWKINLPKIILFGIPSLYISLNSFFLAINNQFIQNTAAYPFHILKDSLSLDYYCFEYYAPVFQFILGYSIITSLFKYNDITVTKSHNNGVYKHIEKVLILAAAVFTVMFVMLNERSTISVPDIKNIDSLEIIPASVGPNLRGNIVFDLNRKGDKDTADNILKWLKSGKIECNAKGEFQSIGGSDTTLVIAFKDGTSVGIKSAVGSIVTKTSSSIMIHAQGIPGQVTVYFEHGSPIRILAPELQAFINRDWEK